MNSASPYYQRAGQWIGTEECDALLFSCLYAVGANTPFPIEQAYFCEEGPAENLGKLWHRRPKLCGGCSSTISRDMFMGLFAYILHFRRLDLADQLWTDLKRLKGRMGNETKTYPFTISLLGYSLTLRVYDTRTWFTPGLVALLAQIRAHLRGTRTWWRFLPQVYSTSPGYVSHLTMLHLYMNLRLNGKLSSKERGVLEKVAQHSPRNPLLLALLGDSRALNAWQPERVPTSNDWIEEWYPQRADGDSSHRPAPVGAPLVVHSGGDYLFTKHVLGLVGGG